MRYRIVRLGSGFDVYNLTEEKAEVIHDGEIITYFLRFLGVMIGETSLKVSEATTEKQLIEALRNEIEII